MVQPQSENVGGGDASGGAGGGTPSSRLAVSLKGDLPCVQCGYELRGVSILGVCPECGTAVRATLLAVIDPLAQELQPIARPRLVAAGLLMWVGGFCLAGVLVCGSLIRQLLMAWSLGEAVGPPRWQAWALAPLVLIAGVGALLVARPHDHVSRRDTLMAVLAALLHLPLAGAGVMLSNLHTQGWGAKSGSMAIGPLAVVWEPSPDRTLLRLAAGAAGLGVIVFMRPVTRVLVARSLAIRTGRVDRQTLLATAAAIVMVMAGDSLGLLARTLGGTASEWLLLAAVTVLAFGSLLLFIGLFSSLVDSVRIARAIVRPGPSMHQVIHGHGGGEGVGGIGRGGL